MKFEYVQFMFSYTSRCPTEECQRAEPFDDTTPSTTPHPTQPPTPTQPPPPNPTTTSAPTTAPTTVPITSPTTDPLTPPGDKICVDAGIREEFFSSIGNDYCKTVCVGKKQRLCNLYLCWCKTDWFLTWQSLNSRKSKSHSEDAEALIFLPILGVP